MKVVKVLSACVAILLFPGESNAASFDCSKAGTPVERMICGDPKVSELDSKLSELYKKALAAESNPDTLKADQRAWLSQQRNKCQDITCLTNSYSAKIMQFEAGSASESDKVVASRHVLMTPQPPSFAPNSTTSSPQEGSRQPVTVSPTPSERNTRDLVPETYPLEFVNNLNSVGAYRAQGVDYKPKPFDNIRIRRALQTFLLDCQKMSHYDKPLLIADIVLDSSRDGTNEIVLREAFTDSKCDTTDADLLALQSQYKRMEYTQYLYGSGRGEKFYFLDYAVAPAIREMKAQKEASKRDAENRILKFATKGIPETNKIVVQPTKKDNAGCNIGLEVDGLVTDYYLAAKKASDIGTFTPSRQGEYEKTADYQQRTAKDKSAFEAKVADISRDKVAFRRRTLEGVLASVPGYGIKDIKYNPDMEQYEGTLCVVPGGSKARFSIHAPIAEAPSLRDKLSSIVPTLFYDFDGQGLSLKGVVFKFEDRTFASAINPVQIASNQFSDSNIGVVSDRVLKQRAKDSTEAAKRSAERAEVCMPINDRRNRARTQEAAYDAIQEGRAKGCW